jgi:MFS family permease
MMPPAVRPPTSEFPSSSAVADSRLVSGQRGAVVTAFLALFSVVGVALYGLPRFYPFFVEDLHWTRQQVTSGNAYSKIAIALLFGVLAGRLVDRFGPRRLMLAGITMAGGALVGLSTVSGFTGFYLFYGLNALGYVLGGPLPNQVLLSRWFDRARGRAMGIAYLGIGVGGALVPLLAYQLTTMFGWRGALRALGLVMIVVALPAAVLVREPPIVPAPPRGESPSLRGAMSRWSFYLLLLGSMASIGAVGGTMQNLALYLRGDRVLPQGQIDGILSLVLVGSIAGRLLMGWLADRWAKKHVMLLVYAIVAASIPPLFYVPNGAPLGMAAFLFGVGLGGDYMVIPLMAAELYGLSIMGRVMGVVLTADSIAEATIPMLVASIRDSSGSYAGGFVVLVALASLGAGAVSFLPDKTKAKT